MLKKELYTVFLDPEGALDDRDDLAKTFYSLLFAWLNEHLQGRFYHFHRSVRYSPEYVQPSQPPRSILHQLRQRTPPNWIQKSLFERHVNEYTVEGISRFIPQVSYFDNAECIRLLQNIP